MNQLLSQKFRFYTFISILLVVLVHCYNLNNRYLQPFTIVEEPITVSTFIEYWVSNGLVRFIIPLLFIISGYLFAFGDNKPYQTRIKKRVRTVLVPYLFWSAFALLLTYCLQHFPNTNQALKDAQLDQLGDNRPYSLFNWTDILLRWIVFPVAFQLWFLRCLFIYNLAYLWILKAIIKYPKVWFGVCGFLWLATFGAHFIEGEGLLFFSLGIYIQKGALNLFYPSRWLRPKYWLSVYLGAGILKTFLAFHLPMGFGTFVILSLLHKATVLSGLIVVWFGLDKVVVFWMKRQWFVSLCSFSFIIYGIHVPFVSYAICYLFRYYPVLLYHRLIMFFILPFSTILLALLIGTFIKFLIPKLYNTLTGGRG